MNFKTLFFNRIHKLTLYFICKYIYNIIKKILKYFYGYSFHPNFLNSIGLDDLDIAEKMLKDHSLWYDESIVIQYQDSFAQWNGSKYAYAFMSGRVALSACIYALDLKQNDEVIIPGYTCVAVPNSFLFAGVKTIYCDIELDTYGLDSSAIEDKINANTKAILLHHIYGLVCRDYEKIITIARTNNLFIIEDCTQSTGAEYKNRKVGNYGDISFYSSEQSKVLNTIQGGLAVTNNDVLAKRLQEYHKSAPYPANDLIEKQLYSLFINYYSFNDRLCWLKGSLIRELYKDKIIITTTKKEEYGIKPTYYGAKMPAPIASIGINQLKKIDIYNHKRRATIKKWEKWCDLQGYNKPLILKDSLPVFLRYPVLVTPEMKMDTRWAHKSFKVKVGVWFISNIHPSNRPVSNCPNADIAVQRCINFPSLIH
jgi:perosamine synthetase